MLRRTTAKMKLCLKAIVLYLCQFEIVLHLYNLEQTFIKTNLISILFLKELYTFFQIVGIAKPTEKSGKTPSI